MKNLLKKIALTLSLVVGIMSIPFPAFAADDEKIVKEFLSEIHSHHPRKIMKEAEIILDNLL